jgi:hypothetical protein
VPVAAPATLSEYLNQWLDHIGPTRSTTTVRGYRFKIERISARLGNIRLDRLTAQHLDRALPAMARPRPPPQQRPPPPPGPFRRPASGRQVGPGRRGRHPACPPAPTVADVSDPDARSDPGSHFDGRTPRGVTSGPHTMDGGSRSIGRFRFIKRRGRAPALPDPAARPAIRGSTSRSGRLVRRGQLFSTSSRAPVRRRCHPVPSASGPARRDGRGDRTSVTPEVPPPPQTIGVPAPRRPRSVTHVPFPPRAPICAESVCLGR